MSVRPIVTMVTIAALALLAGCGAMRTTSGTISRDRALQATDWRNVATEMDRQRLRNWWSAWADALASARAAGHGADIVAQGALLEPQAALSGVNLLPGDYRCRVIKLGAQTASGLAYVAYPQFRCRIRAQADRLDFEKLTGSQRHHGLLFADEDPRRLVFLGTLALGDEQRPPDYGADAARNQAAWVERIGPARWRLVFPRPAFESIIDVLELVPA